MRYKPSMDHSDKNNNDNVYEATWAPADPREPGQGHARFGDGKVGSKVRILGVMHPVLNLFVLAFDSIFNRSRLVAGVLLLILTGLLVILWLSGLLANWK